VSAASELPAARRPLTDQATPRAIFEMAMREHSQELGNFFLAKLLGFEVSYTEDSCVVEFTAHEYLQNPRGLLHGGVLATAMDISMGHLVQRIGGPGATVTLEAQYHRAVSSGRLRCEGKVVHRGGSLWFLHTRVTNESSELVASGACTVSLARVAEA
jgi:acyl-CoA thioesterase